MACRQSSSCSFNIYKLCIMSSKALYPSPTILPFLLINNLNPPPKIYFYGYMSFILTDWSPTTEVCGCSFPESEGVFWSALWIKYCSWFCLPHINQGASPSLHIKKRKTRNLLYTCWKVSRKAEVSNEISSLVTGTVSFNIASLGFN